VPHLTLPLVQIWGRFDNIDFFGKIFSKSEICNSEVHACTL
jgi:hypothetical protein